MDSEKLMDEIKRLTALSLKNAKPLFDQQIAKHSYAAIVELATGNIIHSTPKINELFGYDSIESKNIKDLMPGRFRGKHDAHLNGYKEHPVEKSMGERAMSLYGLHAKGHEFEIAITLSPLPEIMDGQYAMFQVVKTKNN